MDNLAAAAVDEKLADALQSAKLKQQAAEIQRRVAAARLGKLKKAEPLDEDAIELAKLAVEQAANRVAQEAQRVSTIKAQVSKAAEQMALALELPEEPEESKTGSVWNWWTATDEEKAAWIDEIAHWLNDYLYRTFPQMHKARYIPDCWKSHADWLEMLGAFYQDWVYVHTLENPEFKLWWLTKWRKMCTESWKRESSANQCGFPPTDPRTRDPERMPSIRSLISDCAMSSSMIERYFLEGRTPPPTLVA